MAKHWSAAFEQELRDRLYPGQTTIDEALAENSDLDDPRSRGVLVPDRTLLDAVQETHEATLGLRDAFVLAVWRAHDAGFTNTQIAGKARMTEAGVRQILRRTRRPRELDRT